MTILRYLLLSQLLASAAIDASIIRLDRPVPAEYGARVVAVHEDRVLIKPDSAVALTTDFVMRFSDQRGQEFTCGIAGTLFGFAASDSIANATLEWITKTERLDVVALLDSAQVSERLVIGLPECMRSLAYRLSPVHTADSNRFEFRYYSSAQEAEIERQLGRWDIYIVPETEVEPESAVVFDGYQIGEWHLLVKENVDDLAATALNYCAKGAFGAAGSPAVSTLIDEREIAAVFPRNIDYASGLFADLKKSQRISELSFEFVEQLPNTAAALAELISGCQRLAVKTTSKGPGQASGSFNLIPSRSGSGLTAVTSPVYELGTDSLFGPFADINEIPVLVEADRMGIKWRAGLDSLISGTHIAVSGDSLLSRSLSDRCRIIPLGRTRLVARLGIHARCLQLPGRPATLRHFYSKAR